MADITNPQVVSFANEKARRVADMLQTTRRTCEQFMIEIPAIEAATAAAADKDPLIDGSHTDGRKPVSKENIAQLKFVVEQVLAALDADDRKAIVGNWAVNGQPLF